MGDGVTGQDRDPLTGLYPITLTTVPPYEDSSSSGSNTGCDQGTSLGDNKNSLGDNGDNKNISLDDITEKTFFESSGKSKKKTNLNLSMEKRKTNSKSVVSFVSAPTTTKELQTVCRVLMSWSEDVCRAKRKTVRFPDTNIIPNRKNLEEEYMHMSPGSTSKMG